MKRLAATLVLATALVPANAAYAREPFEEGSPPVPPIVPTPDPVAFVVPAGLYYVTDTYVADVVATSDATTTYSTTTVHESTGTYARVVDSIGTGSPARYLRTSAWW